MFLSFSLQVLPLSIMRWTKPKVEGGVADFSALTIPTAHYEQYLNQTTTDVVVLATAYCECRVLHAYENGEITVFEDLGDVEKWSTSEPSEAEGEGWQRATFERHYANYVRAVESKTKVSIYFLPKSLRFFYHHFHWHIFET